MVKLIEVVLIHGNIVNIDYQNDSGVLHTFAPNKSFGQVLDISPKPFALLKTFNSEFSEILKKKVNYWWSKINMIIQWWNIKK